MQNLHSEVYDKLVSLNLILEDEQLSKKIISIAFQSVSSFIYSELGHFFDLSLIKHIVIDLVISEYLTLIKYSYLDTSIDFSPAIKSISEGDVSISYSPELTPSKSSFIDYLINHFSSKKTLLKNFSSIRW